MLNITNIPAPRVPFIDERTGLMAREWYRFFLNLFVLTGSGNNPITLEELQLGPPNQPDLTELLIQINQNIAPQYEDQSGDFLATLDTAQLMSMMSRFENAEAAIQGAYLQPVVQTGTIANYNLDSSPTAGGVAYGTGPALAVSAAGTLGQVLTSGGAGAPTWTTDGGGTVTSVAALTLGTSGTDLSSTVANGTTTPVITLQVPTASASNRGALSAADWSTFNSKGSGTVTSVTGTAPVVSSGGATPAISMAAATTSVNGYLTSTDWTTFNNKGSGTVTSVSFTGGIITVATATTTPALTVAGTSGGIPYFSGASTWATSALLTNNAIMLGGGAAAAPKTTTTGTGVVTALGVDTGTAGAFVVNGGALGTPSSGSVTNLTGTASININGTVGATTPSTVVATTLNASGAVNLATGGGQVGVGGTPENNAGVAYQFETLANPSSTQLARFRTSDYVRNTSGSGLFVSTGTATGNSAVTVGAFATGFAAYGEIIIAGSTITIGVGTPAVTIPGSLGIGVAPSYQLQVNTDSAAKPGIGGLWTVVSDERIKSDISPADLDRCYEIVKSVPLKYFGFAPNVYADNQINDKHNLGWIAQDVQKVFKNAVSVKPFTLKTGEVIDDCLDLNGGQMIAALYGSVQALMAKVETQAARITQLESAK